MKGWTSGRGWWVTRKARRPDEVGEWKSTWECLRVWGCILNGNNSSCFRSSPFLSFNFSCDWRPGVGKEDDRRLRWMEWRSGCRLKVVLDLSRLQGWRPLVWVGVRRRTTSHGSVTLVCRVTGLINGLLGVTSCGSFCLQKFLFDTIKEWCEFTLSFNCIK